MGSKLLSMLGIGLSSLLPLQEASAQHKSSEVKPNVRYSLDFSASAYDVDSINYYFEPRTPIFVLSFTEELAKKYGTIHSFNINPHSSLEIFFRTDELGFNLSGIALFQKDTLANDFSGLYLVDILPDLDTLSVSPVSRIELINHVYDQISGN